jgi:hypothetical protein
MDFLNFLLKSMRQEPFISAEDKASMSSGSGGGDSSDIPGNAELGGDDATPEILAQYGISTEDFNAVKGKSKKAPGLAEVKSINSKKEAQKGPEKKAKSTTEGKNLSTEDMLKALNEQAEQGEEEEEESEEIPSEDEDVDDALPAEDEEEDEEDEEYDEAAKADRMRHKDYTEKTQKLAKEKKGFESWKKETEKELETSFKQLQKDYQDLDEKISNLETWNAAIDIIREEQPELYEAIMDGFKGVQKQFRNPMVDRQLKAMQKELAELRGQNQGKQQSEKTQSDTQIRESFNRELKSTQTRLGPQFQKLGIKIDWGAVTDNWIDSGAKTVEKAVYNVYGDSIAKRYESRDRLGKIQKRVEIAKTPTSKRGTRAPSRGAEQVDSTKLGWKQLTDAILSKRVS